MQKRIAMALLLFILLNLLTGGAAKKEQLICIDIEQMSLTLYEDRAEVKRYVIAAGANKTPTPTGVFRITHRFTTELSGFGTCFLGLNVPWGQYGIHGTNKPGSIGAHVSHGCIRMFVRDAEDLYKRVRNGTKVIIEGSPYGDVGYSLRTLQKGDRGNLVRAVQDKLRALGYFSGTSDGVYGELTHTALKRFAKDRDLKYGQKVDWTLYGALGITPFE